MQQEREVTAASADRGLPLAAEEAAREASRDGAGVGTYASPAPPVGPSRLPRQHARSGSRLRQPRTGGAPAAPGARFSRPAARDAPRRSRDAEEPPRRRTCGNGGCLSPPFRSSTLGRGGGGAHAGDGRNAHRGARVAGGQVPRSAPYPVGRRHGHDRDDRLPRLARAWPLGRRRLARARTRAGAIGRHHVADVRGVLRRVLRRALRRLRADADLPALPSGAARGPPAAAGRDSLERPSRDADHHAVVAWHRALVRGAGERASLDRVRRVPRRRPRQRSRPRVPGRRIPPSCSTPRAAPATPRVSC